MFDYEHDLLAFELVMLTTATRSSAVIAANGRATTIFHPTILRAPVKNHFVAVPKSRTRSQSRTRCQI